MVRQLPARTLRLVQVLHRHGDRSPLHNVFRGGEPCLADAEDAVWIPKLHEPQSTTDIYGALTTTGVYQMEGRGRKLRDHCRAQGWTLDGDDVDIHARSTHYVRTQRSVQALLSQFVPHAHSNLTLEILPPTSDYINAYNANADSIMQLKTHLVEAHAALATREAAMASVQTELRRLLPMFSSGSEAFSWMKAADYYICRHAHGIPFLRHTEDLAAQTIAHLTYRFHEFYSHGPILRRVAGPLVQQLVAEMQNVMDGNTTSAERVVIYSGHDVSLLAFLNAFHGAAQQCRGAPTVVEWPDYAAAVTMELYEEHSANSTPRWVVQVTLDGAALGPTSAAASFCRDLLDAVSLPSMDSFP
ncbi:hypothetical protein H310_02710 [Aphanomyces invadans]|uniref:Uncharacterized protein n=1 Tax=Aphanomyces invadans TaxID=157072 RepID=A0A024UJJ8_9STRA|nr:hypothetical protein H310_02710 [Aphanomyces invadans]ETW06454.1 hypothetical protein H310_02710 [Aphanomyces invadans]|eukprot:XP_008864529.1 hypothetical protein H310_02710 [Aphanomyces invadans]